MPEMSRAGQAANRNPGGPAPARAADLCRPPLEGPGGAGLGPKWEVLAPDDAPGLPAYVAAVVGRCGTVLVTQLVEGGPLVVDHGKLLCSPDASGDGPIAGPAPSGTPISLESPVSELGALANELALRLEGRAPVPMVYAAVLVPGAKSSLFHRDVLVTTPRGLLRGIEAFPAVQLPAAIAKSASDLKQVAEAPLGSAPAGSALAGGPGRQAEPAPDVVHERSEEAGAGGSPISGGPVVPLSALSRRRPGGPGLGPLRRRPVAVRNIALALATFVAGGAIAWYAANQQRPPSSAGAAGPAVTVDGTSGAAGAFVPYVSYAGRQSGDVVAGATGALVVDGASLSLSPPVVVPALSGHLLLCVGVKVRNGARSGLPDQAVNWAVSTPSGALEHPAKLADNVLLGRGQLVPGDTVEGRLCFAEPGQAGLYVLTYSPRSTRAHRGPRVRGVWLMDLAGT